jgi:Zn-dependent protease
MRAEPAPAPIKGHTMKQTIRLGRAGIPIGVHWSVLVIAALLTQGLAMSFLPATAPGQPSWTYWLVATLAAALFLASLLAHELAHALVAHRHHMQVERVTLWLLGGVAELGGQPDSPRTDLRVAAVGPLTSLAAGGTFFAAAFAGAGFLPRLLVAALFWLALINVILAVFNMLPAAPMDGGRILRALLWRHWGDQARAQRVAARAGQGLGTGLVALGALELLLLGSLGGIWLALIGWFLTTAAGAEQRAGALTDRFRDLPVRAAMSPPATVGYADETVQEFLTRVAVPSRQRVFVVIDRLGRPAGAVSLAGLARLAPGVRVTTPLGRAAAPVRPVDAGRRLADVASMVWPGSAPLAVVEDGTLVGTLDAADLSRAAELTTLGEPVGLFPRMRPTEPGDDTEGRTRHVGSLMS